MKDRVKFLICILIVIILGAAIYFYKLEFIKNEEKNIANNNQIIEENNEKVANEDVYEENDLNTNNEELVNNTIIQNADNQNNNSSTKNDLNSNDSNIHLVKTASPSGFAGSSLQAIKLYSDGSVYLVTYDGEGTDDSNIGSKELIATNAENIYEITYDENNKEESDDVGSVVVKGSNLNVIDNGYGWIIFEK